jgi:putative ABC transport system permease protein
MKGPLHLAWRYLLYNRVKTAILVAAIALIAFLPAGLNVLIGESAAQLTSRAEATPLLIGARGSPLELVLSSLYFAASPPASATFSELERAAASGLAEPIPLHVRFRARGHPIVGTTLEYFEFRGLELAAGRPLALVGDCVLGARAAESLDVGPGGTLISSPESVFDLAGVYPLKMRVAGVLAPSFGPDDDAVFVDVKTAWIIEGLGHGHQDLAEPGAADAVLAREGNRITANASVVQYNEITADNLDSFHFHDDLSRYPITALIAVPRDEKSGVILSGRYQGADESAQIVRPIETMNELLDTVFTVRSYVIAAMGTVGVATLATAGLVFMLSLRLRRREIETMVKIGGSRASVAVVLVSEVVSVLVLGASLAVALTLLARRFGAEAIQAFLLS